MSAQHTPGPKLLFPISPTTIWHQHGGTVTKVYGCEFIKGKPRNGHSTDYWFFRADVAWNDGSKSEKTEVPPHSLCCDDPANNAELSALLGAMNEFLGVHGEWKRDAKAQGWFAHRGPGRTHAAIAKATGSAS